MAVTEKQQQKIDALLRYIRDYLQARFDHACRVNPTLRSVADDLIWQQLMVVHQIVEETKAFGPERFCVIDILTSFDMRKKNALFSLTDQNTIFNEIVSEVGREKAQKKMEGVTITDIGAFYKTIDPSVENSVLLIQSFIWWDLPDALDLLILDLQLDRMRSLKQTQMSPELLSFYRNEMNNMNAELTMPDIIAFELKRSRETAASFLNRRPQEPGYRMIVKRDNLPDSAIDGVINTMAQRLRAIEQMQKSDALDQTLKEHYGRVLRLEPDAVTPERAVAFEREAYAAAKQQLRKMLDAEHATGEPYDYKHRQIGLVKDKLQRIEAVAQAAD